MFNKRAEYEKRVRTYLACRGMLRIKQADATSDAINAANSAGDRLYGRVMGDAGYDELRNRAILGGGMAGSRAAGRARSVGDAIAGGLEGMGRDIGRGFEHNGDFFEDLGSRAGAFLGRGARGVGEGVIRGLSGAGAYLSEAGKGVYDGMGRAAKGLGRGLKNIGNGIFNGLDNWGADIAKNTGAHGFGAATGLGLGYLGHKAGNNIADYFKLGKDDWRRKALKWGLAGLSGLGGYWAGTGLAKGFGKGFNGGGGPSTSEPKVPGLPGPAGNKALPGEERRLAITDERTPAEKAEYARRKLKEEQAAEATGRTGTFGVLNAPKLPRVKNIPGGVEFQNIGPVVPRKAGK